MKRRRSPGTLAFTLVELLVAVSVLAFITMLLYGAFSGMKRTRDGLARTQARYREGRIALTRFVRDLESAYISAHAPLNEQLAVQKTAFMGHLGNPADRIDFNAFSNVRRDRDSHVTDQLEVSYFGGESLDEPGTTDLLRRSSTTLDDKPDEGGRVQRDRHRHRPVRPFLPRPHDEPVVRHLGHDAGGRATEPVATPGSRHARLERWSP